MEQSRYTTYHKTRIPKRKRTIRLQGSFEDRGKYIRCWNCGFIVDTDRDLGDPEHSGNNPIENTVPSYSLYDTGTPTKSSLDTLDAIGTGVYIDNIINTYTNYKTVYFPNVSRGCPFCGCTNLL